MKELALLCAVCGYKLRISKMSSNGGIQIEPCQPCFSYVQQGAAELKNALDNFIENNYKVRDEDDPE